MIQELVPLWDADNDTLDGEFKSSATVCITHHLHTVPAATSLINKYNDFCTKVVELNLPGALDEKPRLDVGTSARRAIESHYLIREEKLPQHSTSNLALRRVKF